MIEIIKELNVEVTKPNIFQALVAKQYDMNTRFLKVTLMDCGTRINIPATDTTKVIINAERKDGQSKGFDGVINDDGTVTVPLHSWMLELDGTVICDISVIDIEADNNKKLTTTSFTLIVEKAAYGGDEVTNDPQYDVLVQLVEICTEASVAAQEALEKSNTANAKYEACVEATENANAVREEIEAGGYIESLKELNKGGKFTTWIGTQAEYDALETIEDNCLYLITDEIGDYIVERGSVVDEATSATWYYEKWNSGKAVCWCSVSFNDAISTEIATSLYRGNSAFPNPAYPFQFAATPNVQFSLVYSTGAHIFYTIAKTSGEDLTQYPPVYYLYKHWNDGDSATVNVTARYYVTGYWK